MATEEQLRTVALSLPEGTERPSHGYAAVLVRLPVVGAAELRELVTDSWRLRAPRRLVAAFDADAATGG